MTVLQLGVCATDNCRINRFSPEHQLPSPSSNSYDYSQRRFGIAVLDIGCIVRKVKHSKGLSMEVYMPLRGRDSTLRASRCCALGCHGADFERNREIRSRSNPSCLRRWLPNALGTDKLGFLSGRLQMVKYQRRKCLRLMPVRSTVADMEVDITGGEIADDYYSVLGVPPDATPEEIKKAYYSCMKACHPDLAGENAETTTFCMFVNEIYEILSDPVQRMVYDEIHGYALMATNPFLDMSKPRDHVFVDEFSCIGCKNCANTAPKTFDIEEEFGRARVVSQCGRLPLVQQAIETCPVDCIHWVSAAQISLLEDEMRRTERVNVGLMLSGMGFQAPDVFTLASWRWEKRQARAMERARIQMMKEKNKTPSGPWWQNIWNQSAEVGGTQTPVDEETRERASKAAAAARRWREYSRRGVDRRPIYKLPVKVECEAEDGGSS